MAILGAKPTAPTGTTERVLAADRNQRALGAEAFVAPEPSFVVALGAMLRRSVLTATGTRVWLALWAADPNGGPGALLARTAPFLPPDTLANVTAPVVWTAPDRGGSATALRLAAGETFRLGVLVAGGDVDLAVVAGTADRHYRTATLAAPSDPFLPEGGESGVVWAVHAVADANRAPLVPTNLVPAAGATLDNPAPTFAGDATDPDAPAPWGDRLSAYRVAVRRTDTQADLWPGAADGFVASAEERAARRFSRAFDGPALPPGVPLEWRAQTADAAGAYGAWSAWRALTINALGAVSVADGEPTGKQDGDPALLAWSARWSQPQGHATDRVRVRVVEGGAVLKLGREVLKTIPSSLAPGTLFTVTAAEAGVGFLPGGRALAYQIQARDATTVIWSPWSGERAFSTNAVPTVPANLQPPNGASSTSRPLLEFATADADEEDVEGIDVLFDVEITAPNGVVAVSETGAYDPARGVASLRTTETHVPVYGVYRWRARSRDLSAGAFGVSAWSAPQSFTYAAGPVVTIDAPADGRVYDTATPTFAFSVTGPAPMVRFRPYLFLADAPIPFHASPAPIVSGVGLWTPPPGVLRNGGAYDVLIGVWDANNQPGVSLRRAFSVAYGAPAAPSGLVASGSRNAGDPEDTSVLLSWGAFPYPPGEFGGWIVTRRLLGEMPEAAVRLRTIAVAGQTRWVDHHAPPGLPLVYGVALVRRLGSETLVSATAEATARIDLTCVVLASARDGGALRCVLRYGMTGSPPTVAGSRSRGSAKHIPWGTGGKPIRLRTPGEATTITLSGFRLVDAPEASREAAFARLLALDASGHEVSLRDRRGRRWVTLDEVGWTDEHGSDAIDITAGEISYTEGG